MINKRHNAPWGTNKSKEDKSKVKGIIDQIIDDAIKRYEKDGKLLTNEYCVHPATYDAILKEYPLYYMNPSFNTFTNDLTIDTPVGALLIKPSFNVPEGEFKIYQVVESSEKPQMLKAFWGNKVIYVPYWK